MINFVSFAEFSSMGLMLHMSLHALQGSNMTHSVNNFYITLLTLPVVLSLL